MSLSYYIKEESVDGVIYSIDKLILDFKFKVDKNNDFTGDFGLFLSWLDDVEYWHAESHKIGSFRNSFSFKCSNGCSYWVGVGLNDGTGRIVNKIRLEFNPNKVASQYEFVKVFNRMIALSAYAPRIVRFDLALDFPVLRQNCFLFKDQRLYEECSRSREDSTQYLGQRNKHGRCKLYNKQIESKLNFPLTRFELTIERGHERWEEVKDLVPKIMYLDDFQLCFESEKLNLTDQFILKTIMYEPQRLSELSWHVKKKIERIMSKYVRYLAIDEVLYNKILTRMNVFCQLLDSNFIKSPWDGFYNEVELMSLQE